MRIKERLRAILSMSDTPHKIAISFAVGLFLAFSPLLGLHTVSALLLAWAFKLNKVAILTGVFVNNPWTIIPMYTFATWVGAIMTGSKMSLPKMDMESLNVTTMIKDFGVLLVPFVVGTIVVGAVSGVASYFAVKHAVKTTRGIETKKEGENKG